jgi:hypothetical protein
MSLKRGFKADCKAQEIWSKRYSADEDLVKKTTDIIEHGKLQDFDKDKLDILSHSQLQELSEATQALSQAIELMKELRFSRTYSSFKKLESQLEQVSNSTVYQPGTMPAAQKYLLDEQSKLDAIQDALNSKVRQFIKINLVREDGRKGWIISKEKNTSDETRKELAQKILNDDKLRNKEVSYKDSQGNLIKLTKECTTTVIIS